MRIGIVGAENSHCAHIAKALNADKALPGCEVTHVWGETAEFAKKAAEEGSIPNIVDEYTKMIGSVDGVVVDHRHGKYHLPAAREFVDAGVPVFVDKPFCVDLQEGVEFVRFARSKRVPVTSFSIISLQQSVLDFTEKAKTLGKLRSVVTSGPADVNDQYGGVFFYGIHQVEMICNLLGKRPLQVTATRHGVDGVATITFEDGPIGVLTLLKDWWTAGFVGAAYGDGEPGAHHALLPFDEKMYVAGIKLFCKMFETKEEPFPPANYLRTIAVLAAMQKAFDTGRPQIVEAVPDI